MKNIVTKETVVTAEDTNMETSSPVSHEVVENKAEKSQTATYIIYFLFGLLEFFLFFRLLFRVTGASPTSSFVQFIYSITDLAVMPFLSIFRQTTATGAETTAVFEPGTIIAILVYALLAWGVTQLVMILSRKVQ